MNWYKCGIFFSFCRLWNFYFFRIILLRISAPLSYYCHYYSTRPLHLKSSVPGIILLGSGYSIRFVSSITFNTLLMRGFFTLLGFKTWASWYISLVLHWVTGKRLVKEMLLVLFILTADLAEWRIRDYVGTCEDTWIVSMPNFLRFDCWWTPDKYTRLSQFRGVPSMSSVPLSQKVLCCPFCASINNFPCKFQLYKLVSRSLFR